MNEFGFHIPDEVKRQVRNGTGTVSVNYYGGKDVVVITVTMELKTKDGDMKWLSWCNINGESFREFFQRENKKYGF